MELLIPGLILVAIMVWASTRIKKNAAAAFDAERVETSEIVVEKPEGFLHVLNDNSGLLFRAYSKDFGTVGRSDIRQATIEIERHRNATIDGVLRSIRSASETLDEESRYTDRNERAATVGSVQVRDGAEYRRLHKLVTRGSDVLEGRGEILSEHLDDHLEKIRQMLDTMQFK